jgi:hypothetical protein
MNRAGVPTGDRKSLGAVGSIQDTVPGSAQSFTEELAHNVRILREQHGIHFLSLCFYSTGVDLKTPSRIVTNFVSSRRAFSGKA